MQIKRTIKLYTKVAFMVGIVVLILLEISLPEVSHLQDVRLQVPLKIYSSDAKLIAEYGPKRREPIDINEVPKQLINAVIATEDARFYQHYGVDFRSLARAMIQLIKTGNKDQGASTITMQVARNFFLSREKTYFRKIKEILLAINIELKLSKQEILELYFNKIFFGKRAYGIAAAANIYYGLGVEQLSLAQMAMLAGLPQAPSRINPLNNPESAFKRRQHVLDRMLHYEFINLIEHTSASNEPLSAEYHGTKIELHAPYVAEMVRQELLEKMGDEIYYAGYNVFTTIDSKLQLTANNAVNRALNEYKLRHSNKDNDDNAAIPIQGALVSLKPQDGAIVAMVGGSKDSDSQFNRAVQSKRQPGSSFKPFIYAAALDQGFTAASIVNDAPIVMQTSKDTKAWRPKNHTRQFYGPTRLREGINSSRNLVSIRLLQDIGIGTALQFAKKFGFDTETFPHDLSLALGTCEMSPLTLAMGYSSFANGGFKVTPYIIAKITNYYDNIVFQAEPVNDEQIIEPRLAYIMTSLTQDSFKKFTRYRWRTKRKDLSGKTGSTNDHFDAWYSGFNGDLVTTTWMGFDDPKSLQEYSIKAVFPMWRYFMGEALQDKPDNAMAEPEGIVTARIDPVTGLLAGTNQNNAIYEIFRKENVPTQTATNTHIGKNTGASEEELF